jgi:CubicO group peptidase (beta-lactamase class C family)
MTDLIESILREAMDRRVFSCAAWSTGTAEGAETSGAMGTVAWDGAAASLDTWFDLASVTKPIVALAVMSLIDSGALTLDDTVGEHLPDYRDTDKAAITVRQLLTHTSGIPGQLPMYHWCHTRAEMLHGIRELPLQFEPGSDVTYTSQGFIVLGLIAEVASGMALDALVRERVTGPACMDRTLFGLPEQHRPLAAATEDCPWRSCVVQGSVHDENAEVLGGIAGHAGLFAPLADLESLARVLCAGARGRDTAVLSPAALAVMTTPATDHLRLRRCLGWQGRDPRLSPAGDLAGPNTYGHTGFTGTSIWVDPDAGRYVVLLTNRVHPSRRGMQIARVRRLVHNAAFGGAAPSRAR